MTTDHPERDRSRVGIDQTVVELYEKSPLGYQALDEQGRILSISAAWIGRLGYAREDMVGWWIGDFITPDHQQPFRDAYAQVKSLGEICGFECQLVCKNGSSLWISLDCTVESDESGAFEKAHCILRDIVQRKRFERALEQKILELKSFVGNIPDPAWLKDAESRYIAVNRAFAELIGLEPETLLSQTAEACFGEEAARRFRDGDQAVMKTGERQIFEERTTGPGGEGIWLETIKSPIIDDAGKAVGTVGISRDITARKLSQVDLGERYSMATRAGSVGVWDWDVKTGEFYVDPNVKALLGYRDDEIPYDLKIWSSHVHPDDRKALLTAAQEHLEGKTPEYEFEHRMIHRDESVRWFLVRGKAIRDETGEPVRLVGTVSDITDRKELEQRHRELLDSVMAGIGIVDEHETFRYCNPAAADIYEFETPEDLIGRNVYEFLPEDQRPLIPEQIEIRRRGEKSRYELDIITAKGNRRTILVSATPRIIDGVYRGTIGNMLDITDRKKFAEELAKTQKLESVGVLAGGIAHDFNNILSGVLGNIELAKLELSPGSIGARLLLDAEKAALRGAGLTKRLLTFSKGGAPVKERASVSEIIRESAEFALSGSNVKCVFDLAHNLPEAEVDRGQFSQVIQNLAINADQAMTDGGVLTIVARGITSPDGVYSPQDPGELIEITVTDTGPGIPADILGKVFDPFFTTKSRGSGLGLATSYSIIEKHGGRIEVESVHGAGATFRVHLPATLKSVPPPASASARLDPDPERASVQAARILFVDDDETIRDVVAHILRDGGFSFTGAATGKDCLEKYRASMEAGAPHDMVFLDLTIPGSQGGRDIIRELQELDPSVKAVVCSGYANDPVMSGFADFGFMGALANHRWLRSPSICSRILRLLRSAPSEGRRRRAASKLRLAAA